MITVLGERMRHAEAANVSHIPDTVGDETADNISSVTLSRETQRVQVATDVVGPGSVSFQRMSGTVQRSDVHWTNTIT